ncbi:hypothetical protein [Alkaliphilus sp. B6464]|uniref:hypothetical protein n=1 Tax=Alkaliphilus sp. B6464 TaxID=2731219 RepID=UPI001BA9BA37|nr:hypothetical protein [Alkaliphilus sp. B6464]QUH20166.1 hypothetical protein HYG84_09780 [Alkaliphilus sp. B6464]
MHYAVTWSEKGKKGKKIVVGTHGNIMSIILDYYNDKYGYEFWRGLSMPGI